MNTQENEKPSKTRQWQERSERPIASRPMTPQEIVSFMRTLADSYKCEVSDITYDFEKIQDENDTDRDDCLWLMYKMKCVVGGKPGTRDIFRIKLPIPEEVRRAGELARQRQAQQGRKPRALMAPDAVQSQTPSVQPQSVPSQQSEPAAAAVPPTVVPPPVAVPKVRRPVKRK
jgi:hypothetical protein